jgi:GT2 family glycosyltransferase
MAGGFDETFPYPGGEDSLMAYNLRRLGFRIKYCPDVMVFHEARDSLNDFLRWQFKRGISSFLFSSKIDGTNKYMRLRAWSSANIISHYFGDKKFPLIVSLLFIGYITQLMGFSYAKWSKKFHASINH